MRKQQVIIALCVMAIGVTIFTFGKQARPKQASRPQARLQQDNSVPEHVAYAFLFRSASVFRSRAVEAGRPLASNPVLIKEAHLDDAQARVLEEIAATTLQDVERQDARARIVINAFRARYPNGIVPKGEKLPEPPPELKAMQEERNTLLLRGRDRLRAALGEQEFARFHEFALRRFAGKGLFNKEQQ